MLTNEVVLKIFEEYLAEDQALEVVLPATAMRSCYGTVPGRIGPR